MKKVFYLGLLGLALYEICKVYFIMPMPGSQQQNTIDLAYFLHVHRWWFRIAFALMSIGGSFSAFSVKRKWLPALAMVPVLMIIYFFNFEMIADHMFLQPSVLTFSQKSETILNDSSVVLTVAHAGEAKAYPVRYILYHHQVRDTIAGKPIMVTYCNVCRTGRVYEPSVNGKPEHFRLVGMDHFNAMFEDDETKSWWLQATGQAITGPLKGTSLTEVESFQSTLGKFFALHPFGKVMRPDTIFSHSYDSIGRYEKGRSKGKLTRKDSLSWKDKSWVVGVQVGNSTKAYDWIDLTTSRIILDEISNTPIVVVLSDDGQTFGAFQRNSATDTFSVSNDSLVSEANHYDLAGRNKSGNHLKRLKAYQEFWHSWRTFHPTTERYQASAPPRSAQF